MGANSTSFKKNDPRIWKHGRPKSFDALREMSKRIAEETAMVKNKETGQVEKLVIEGHTATIAEMIMRQWAQSKDPRLVQAFIEYAYGKVPNVINGDQEGGPVVVEVEYVNKKNKA